MSVRPLRSVLFVATPEGVPWQSAFRVALRSQTATWGGWSNLILPVPDEVDTNNELLWALLDVFDADLFQALPIHAGDLVDVAAAYYRERFRARREELINEPVERAHAELSTEMLTSPILDNDLQKLLIGRVAPLSGQGQLSGFLQNVFDPPGSPLVAVERLRPLPQDVVVDVGWPDDDFALMGAAMNGELSPRFRDALENTGVGIIESEVPDTAAAWNAALTIRANSPSRQLANLGLNRYFRPGAPNPGLVICVGDQQWDFALACALERLGVDACWVPPRAAEDLVALSTLAGCARRARQYATTGRPPRICTVASPQALADLSEALGGMLKDIGIETCQPIDVVPPMPGRTYERERVGFYQATLLQKGTTPRLPTPIPENVRTDPSNDIRWMTDIDVEGWRSIRHPALAGHLLTLPVTEELTRCGRDVVSYMCPGPLIRPGIGLESQTVRPKLTPATLREQVELVLRAAGWGVKVSDKGIYLQHSADVFGGPLGMIDALSDTRAPLLTAFMVTGEDAPGWELEGRRYLNLNDLRLVYPDEPGSDPVDAAYDADATVHQLEDVGALIRGLVLRCDICRQKRFYRLAEIGDDFLCERCWTRQPVSQASLTSYPEPEWRYGLTEVVFQFLQHNGDLPLLAGYDFMRSRAACRSSRGPFDLRLAGELDLVSPTHGAGDIDVLLADGSELWLAQATVQPKLGDRQKELKRLELLHELAMCLSARGALLISAATWTDKTRARAEATFPDIWPRLTLIDGGRQAERWQAS